MTPNFSLVKLIGGQCFHRGPEYGKTYWEHGRKGLGHNHPSLPPKLSDEHSYLNVLHLGVPEGY